MLNLMLRFCLPALLIILCINPLQAQKNRADKIFAFKITGYIKSLSDSTAVVQVFKPDSFPVAIRDKQTGLLKHCFKAGEKPDTAVIGTGRCNLIKEDYYYFGLRLKKMQQPTEGDVLYSLVKVSYVYDGLLLNVMNHAINFTDVYGEKFMNYNGIFTNTQTDEMNLLDAMVKDIRFTGAEMLKQMPDNNLQLTGGMFKGKKLFEAMQQVNRSELELFLKYIKARPANYAGNDWKISEIFATWMDGGTPTVVENP